MHCGDRGRHTVAPSSIIAWLNVPGDFVSSSHPAVSFSRAGNPARRVADFPSMRVSTRSTFPSTTATGSFLAMLAIAAAV